MKPENDQHPTEMLLDYLEDALSSEDKAQVAAHLEQCQECAEHLEEIKIITTGLRTHKEAFCPEPEELLSYVRTGEDPESRVAEHLDQCQSCRDEVKSYKEASVDETMSPSVREAFESLAGGRTGNRRLADRLSEYIDRLKALFDVPTMALGAAVAAVLVLVVAYPGGDKSSMIALSSVEWKSTLARPKSLLHEEQPYAAIVIMLKGSRTLDKDTVNSLYISLSPTREMRKKYRFRSPAQVTKVMTENKIDPADREAILRSLHKELKVAEVLVITVTGKGDRFHIAYQLVNSKTGATQGSTDLADITEGDLKARFAGPTFALLEGKDRGR
jgi:anti-sigma factor RsiW